MKWTPLGFFKGDLTKNEIVIQAVIGIVIAVVLINFKVKDIMKNKLKIGLVQYAPVWENKAESIEKIKNLVR